MVKNLIGPRDIEKGAATAPIRIDLDAPVGTTFTPQEHLAKDTKSSVSILDSAVVRQDANSISVTATMVGKPGQMITDVYRAQRIALKDQAQTYFASSAGEKAELVKRAAAAGHPLTLEGEDGQNATLTGVSDDGQPTYIGNTNISGADTLGVDQLWPTGTTGVWNDAGNTGLNLSGANEIIGMWDATDSVRVTHEQFGGRVTQLDAVPAPEGNHGTGVAGVLAAGGIPSFLSGAVNVGTWSRGAAYQASVNAYDIADFSGEFSNEASNGLKYSNNSYGVTSGWVNGGSSVSPIWRWFGTGAAVEDWKFGAYTASGAISSRLLDNSAIAAPLTTLVYSAGNDQNEGPGAAVASYFIAGTTTTSTLARDWNDGDAGGYDSMSTLSCAKNVLTVGSINSLETGWTNASAVVQSSFSGSGPTDDGRIKPEVVAQGSRTTTITARNSNGWQNVTTGFNPATPNDASYSLQAGTSFSAPSVTGVLALINQRRTIARSTYPGSQTPTVYLDSDWLLHPMRSSGMRALVAHTADEAGASSGPDYRFGYGVVNAVKAVQLISADSSAGSTPIYNGPKPYYKDILLGAGNTIQFKANRVDATTPLKVTIAWTDPAGAGQTLNAVDQTNARLVNDLDVRIYPPGVVPGSTTKNAATTGKPWILNPDLTTKSAVTRGTAATTGDDARNNLEQVVINNPVAGDYTVVVDHKGSTLSGGGQWVSMALSGNTIQPVNPGIISFTNVGGGVWTVIWRTVPGGLYVLEASLDLVNWTPVTGDVSARAETTSLAVTPPTGSPSYFYRVVRTF